MIITMFQMNRIILYLHFNYFIVCILKLILILLEEIQISNITMNKKDYYLRSEPYDQQQQQQLIQTKEIFEIADNALCIMNKIIVKYPLIKSLNIEFQESILQILKDKITNEFQIVKRIHELEYRKKMEDQIFKKNERAFLTSQFKECHQGILIRFYVRFSQKLFSKFYLYANHPNHLKFISFNYLQLYKFEEQLNRFQNFKNLKFFNEIMVFIVGQNNLLMKFVLQLIVNKNYVTSIDEYYSIDRKNIRVNHNSEQQQNSGNQYENRQIYQNLSQIKFEQEIFKKRAKKQRKKTVTQIVNHISSHIFLKNKKKIDLKNYSNNQHKSQQLTQNQQIDCSTSENHDIIEKIDSQNLNDKILLEDVRKQIIKISQQLRVSQKINNRQYNALIKIRQQFEKQNIQNHKKISIKTRNQSNLISSTHKPNKYRIKKQTNQNSQNSNQKKIFIYALNANSKSQYLKVNINQNANHHHCIINKQKNILGGEQKVYVQIRQSSCQNQKIKKKNSNKSKQNENNQQQQNIKKQNSTIKKKISTTNNQFANNKSSNNRLIYQKYKEYIQPLFPYLQKCHQHQSQKLNQSKMQTSTVVKSKKSLNYKEVIFSKDKPLIIRGYNNSSTHSKNQNSLDMTNNSSTHSKNQNSLDMTNIYHLNDKDLLKSKYIGNSNKFCSSFSNTNKIGINSKLKNMELAKINKFYNDGNNIKYNNELSALFQAQ